MLNFKLLFIFSVFFLQIDTLKILVYNQKIGGSHVGFMGKIADTLAAAGHEVVVYQPIIAENIKFTGSKNETIRFYTTPKNPEDDFRMEEAQEDLWDPESLDKLRRITLWYSTKNTLLCKRALEDTKTLEQLKNENFDLGISEIFSACGFGIFKLIGLERYIATTSSALMFYNYDVLGLKYHVSYVPSMFSLKPDKMNFGDRFVNYLLSFVDYIWSRQMLHGGIEELVQEKLPGFNIENAISDSAFHFINSDEIIDYTQPITQKIVYIGGLGKVQSHPLNNEFSQILESSKKGVIYFSFGTIVHGSHMTKEMRQTFLNAFSEFPDITFLWKYENEEEHIAKGYKNVIVRKWFPQNDILDHPRLLTFISHCGMNSVIEGTTKGVPIICIPIFGDQFHNAVLLEHRGTATSLLKDHLTKNGIVNAIQTILNNDKYKKNAKYLSKLISAKPMSSAEKVVKFTEFAGEFSGTETFQTEGRHQSFIVFHSIDVIATLVTVIVGIIVTVFLIVGKMLKFFKSDKNAQKHKKS